MSIFQSTKPCFPFLFDFQLQFPLRIQVGKCQQFVNVSLGMISTCFQVRASMWPDFDIRTMRVKWEIKM